MPLAKIISLVAFELMAGEGDHSKPSKKTHEDTNIYQVILLIVKKEHNFI